MEQQFVPAAEAMPEDKFFWAPTSGEFRGVRNFAEQLIHVAEVNFALSAAILGESSAKGSSAGAIKTRAAVLQYLHPGLFVVFPDLGPRRPAVCLDRTAPEQGELGSGFCRTTRGNGCGNGRTSEKLAP